MFADYVLPTESRLVDSLHSQICGFRQSDLVTTTDVLPTSFLVQTFKLHGHIGETFDVVKLRNADTLEPKNIIN